MPFIVLCSSRGTVFRATMDRVRDGSLHAPCLGLVTDRQDRGCVAVAEEHAVPVVVVARVGGEDREAYDRRIDEAIARLCADAAVSPSTCILALMGWMRVLSPWFVRRYRQRILNVHPSLLPKYPGMHAHDAVLAAGETESGMTIHFVDEGLDSGPIIEQKKCSVFPDDTVDTLRMRVQQLECEWYPQVLEHLEAEIAGNASHQ